MHPLGHHGMDSAVELFLCVAGFGVPISEVVHTGDSFSASGTRDDHHDASDGTRESLVENVLDFLLGGVRVT
jgi:hypothetical protein